MRPLLWLSLGLALACGGGGVSGVEEGADLAEGGSQEGVGAGTDAETTLRPAFPLRVGDRWVWQVTRHVGAGLRVLFIPTEPATTDVIATWELTIARDLGGGRHAATLFRTAPDGLPARTDLTLWHQGVDLWMDSPQGPRPALEITVPPDAVSVEKVPCTAWFLDGRLGTCSPAPGGPLSVPPGPSFLVLSEGGSPGATLAQILVGIGTAGLVIPGNRAATEYANLVAWTPAQAPPVSERVVRWQASPRPDALPPLLSGVGREEAAAMVALSSPEDAPVVAAALMDALPTRDRWPVLRVALQSQDQEKARLRALASLSIHLTAKPDEARLGSIIAIFPTEQADAARGIVTGEWPLLRAVLLADPPAVGLGAAPGHVPSDAEAQAILAQFDDPAAALPGLLARTPPERQLPLFTLVCAAQGFDDDRVSLLQANPALVARIAREPTAARALLDTFSFDDQRLTGLKLLLAATPPEGRGAMVRLGVQAMDFDDGRLAVLDALPGDVRAMSKAERRAVLEAFHFDREAAEARLR